MKAARLQETPATVVHQKKGGRISSLFLFQKCDVSIYEAYPDDYDALGCPKEDGPWPGNNLICLGSRKASRAGNLQINGLKEILNSEGVASGLPTSDDKNYYPACSGAVGAKIWLVRAEDVECNVTTQVIEESEVAVPPHMIGWNPEDYLFEGKLIVYQYRERPTEE